MKKSKKIVLLVFLITALCYGLKKYGHFLLKFTEGPIALFTSPIQTLIVIETSDLNKSLHEDLYRITQAFSQKIPDQKIFSLSQKIIEREMINQRMLEVNFPRALSAEAKCGFTLSEEITNTSQIIEQIGEYKIVCSR